MSPWQWIRPPTMPVVNRVAQRKSPNSHLRWRNRWFSYEHPYGNKVNILV